MIASALLSAPRAPTNQPVGPRGPFTCTLRGWVRLAFVYVTLAVIAAPAALGAAMGPVMRELGAAQEHVCKCGMPQGKCGCPECALLDVDRHAGRVPDAIPSFKRQCDDDAPAVPFSAGMLAVVPPSLDAIPSAPPDREVRPQSCRTPASPDLEPRTPPPRNASV